MVVDLEKIDTYVQLSEQLIATQDELIKLISYIDLTSLNNDDTEQTIIDLCQMAQTPYGNVAAVCVYSQFVNIAKQYLADTGIKIATVCNFPSGNQTPDIIYQEIEKAIADGANEIDMVMPHHKYAIGETQSTIDLVKTAKQLCGPEILLKVILEINKLFDVHVIHQASCNIIAAGADFIKTSTGKMTPGATPEGAWAMLYAIKLSGKSHVGFKAAGGVREVSQALLYKAISKHLLGQAWVTPKHFRLGASQLLPNILAKLT